MLEVRSEGYLNSMGFGLFIGFFWVFVKLKKKGVLRNESIGIMSKEN